MVHCGYEPTAVAQTFGTARGFLRTARIALFGPPRANETQQPPDEPAGDDVSPAGHVRPSVAPIRDADKRLELPVLN